MDYNPSAQQWQPTPPRPGPHQPAATAASEYVAASLSIIPIQADGSKSPAVSLWKPFQSRLPSQAELDGWFQHNVGLAVTYGQVSRNAELIDIDQADLFQPYREQCELMAPGVFDQLTLIDTPRGFHLVYRCSKVADNQKLAQDADGKTLIETRGQGGYALAPGSPSECHSTGLDYTHIAGPPLTKLYEITPAQRRMLHLAAGYFNKRVDDNEPTHTSNNNGALSTGNDFFNEKLDHFTRGIILRKVKQLIGRAGFTKQDCKDLEQDLFVRVLQSSPRFNPDVAHRNKFITTVVERYIANILRDKQAKKRDHRRISSLNVIIKITDEGPTELAQTIGDRELDARLGRDRRSNEELAQLTIDFDDIIATLPESWRNLLELRKTLTISKIARKMGVPRTTLNDRMRRIRQRFEDAGLRNYLK